MRWIAYFCHCFAGAGVGMMIGDVSGFNAAVWHKELFATVDVALGFGLIVFAMWKAGDILSRV